MALQHAGPGEPWDIRPLGTALAQTQSSALFKSRQLEVMRLVLPVGKTLPAHKVAGEITLQCIEGALSVDAQGAKRQLLAGQLMFLPAGDVHTVTALQDSSALLTIVLA
jgi:quercetin dioxygenase-like cupin family protein